MLVPQLLWLLATAPVAPPAAVVVDVQWSGLPECPNRAALFEAVEQRLGRPLAPGEVTVEARVDREGRGYVLHLKLMVGTRGEEREVRDPSCQALLEATAVRVVAAIAAAPVVPEPEPEPTPVEVPAPEPAPVPAAKPLAPPVEKAVAAVEAALKILTTDNPVPPPVPKHMARKPGLVLRAHGGAEAGTVPVVSGVVGLTIGLLWPRVRLELQTTVVGPQTGNSAGTGTGPSVRAGLFSASLHPCWRLGRNSRLSRGVFELPLCLGLEVGGMRGEARYVPEPRTVVGVWVAALLTPAMTWHVSPRLSMWTSPQLVVVMARPDFQAGSGAAAETIYRPSVVSGRLLLGIELRLRDRW